MKLTKVEIVLIQDQMITGRYIFKLYQEKLENSQIKIINKEIKLSKYYYL